MVQCIKIIYCKFSHNLNDKNNIFFWEKVQLLILKSNFRSLIHGYYVNIQYDE
jgi:hypothetical protein